MSCLNLYKENARNQFSWTELSPSRMAEHLFLLTNILLKKKTKLKNHKELPAQATKS